MICLHSLHLAFSQFQLPSFLVFTFKLSSILLFHACMHAFVYPTLSVIRTSVWGLIQNSHSFVKFVSLCIIYQFFVCHFFFNMKLPKVAFLNIFYIAFYITLDWFKRCQLLKYWSIFEKSLFKSQRYRCLLDHFNDNFSLILLHPINRKFVNCRFNLLRLINHFWFVIRLIPEKLWSFTKIYKFWEIMNFRKG